MYVFLETRFEECSPPNFVLPNEMLFHKPISYILFHTKQRIYLPAQIHASAYIRIIFKLLQICPPQIQILLKLENTIFFVVLLYTEWQHSWGSTFEDGWMEWSWDVHAAACDPIIRNHARVVYFLSERCVWSFGKLYFFLFLFEVFVSHPATTRGRCHANL